MMRSGTVGDSSLLIPAEGSGSGRTAHPRRYGRRLVAALIGAGLVASLTGCSLIAGDLADDEVEEIPAALLASDIGVTEAYAEKTIDGFTVYLSVGVDLDHDELDYRELAAILQIVVDENDLPTDDVTLGVDDTQDESIDLESMMERRVPGVVVTSLYGDVWITMDGAREIIDAVNAEQ